MTGSLLSAHQVQAMEDNPKGKQIMKRKITPRFIPENAKVYKPEGLPNVIIYLYTNQNGKYCLLAYKGKARKPILHVAHMTSERRLSNLNTYVRNWKRYQAQNDAYKAERALPSKLHPGDIVYLTWGHEQTNVDFYEVISLTKSRKSAKIRPLKNRIIKSSPYP